MTTINESDGAMKKKEPKDIFEITFDKVFYYLEMEYSSDIFEKSKQKKYQSIIIPYIKNCISLNKTIPYISQGIATFIKSKMRK